MPKKISRCTLDIDNRKTSSLVRAIRVLRYYGFDTFEIKPSPSGKGFHVVAFHKGKGYYKNKLIKVRLSAGDDEIRCHLDRMANRQINVLFTNKKKIRRK